MIPLRDNNPTHRQAIVVPILIALNVVLFLVEPVLTGSPLDQTKFFACRAAIPYEVTHRESLADAVGRGGLTDLDAIAFARYQRDGFGGQLGPGCPTKNVWLSVLTSMFLHGSILHILGNLLFLWVFGNNVEDRLGRLRFVAFYLLSGLAATLVQSYASPDSVVPLIGASGAIAGVLGAYLLIFPRARVTNLVFLGFFITTVNLPAFVVLGLWFLLQVFNGVGAPVATSGVAYLAHIGGFVAGMLLLLVFRPRPQQPEVVDPF